MNEFAWCQMNLCSALNTLSNEVIRWRNIWPYRPKVKDKKPYLFIFSKFLTEKSEKKGLSSQSSD